MLELPEKNLICHFGEVLVDIKKKCALETWEEKPKTILVRISEEI